MLPLFEMMMQAQNGAAMEVMAKQLDLAQEQATKAIAAMMPAFSAAFRRNAADPDGFAALMRAINSGNYARYFDDIGKAFTPDGMADGARLVEKLFGSKSIADGVAAQAAQMTGIGQDIYQKMMPVLADMMMGGLFKTSAGSAGANPFLNTATGEMMQNWLNSMGFAPKAEPMPQPSVFDNPFTQAMELMFGEQAAKPEQAAPDMGKFNDMMKSMFDSGLEVQKAYQKNLERIFEGLKPDDGKAK